MEKQTFQAKGLAGRGWQQASGEPQRNHSGCHERCELRRGKLMRLEDYHFVSSGLFLQSPG